MFVADCAMFFETLFELAQLVFHLFDDGIECREDCIRFSHRDEFVVMLCPNPQFHAGPFAMFQIDRDTDRGYSIKELSYYFDLLGNFLLRCWAEVTVAGRNGRLHRCYSKADRRGFLAASAKLAKGAGNSEF